jgi:hypothetical protein
MTDAEVIEQLYVLRDGLRSLKDDAHAAVLQVRDLMDALEDRLDPGEDERDGNAEV